jgi:hypothetical protein
MGVILSLAMAVGIVFGTRKLCDLIGAPLWFAKFLFIFASLVATYFLAQAVVPENKQAWGIWVALLCAAAGIIPVGFIVFKHIEGVDSRTERSSRDGHDF